MNIFQAYKKILKYQLPPFWPNMPNFISGFKNYINLGIIEQSNNLHTTKYVYTHFTLSLKNHQV